MTRMRKTDNAPAGSPALAPWAKVQAGAALLWMIGWAPWCQANPSLGVPSAQDCAAERDAPARLACYDRLFPPKAPEAKDAPVLPAAGSATVLSQPAAPVQTPAGSQARERVAAAAPAPSESTLSRFWELDDTDKRAPFKVRTYLPNFLLPVHYSFSLNNRPSSPTRGDSNGLPSYQDTEAKFQVSLRSKVAEDVLLPGADVWLAYTQRSMWQVWNREDSAPFRNTDYQPEAIYVLPIPQTLGKLWDGWTWRVLQLGAAHQSNGQSGSLSRSWNRVYVGAGFERPGMLVEARLHRRIFDASGDRDDNPNITRYIGQGEIAVSWLPGLSTTTFTWRPDFHRGTRGSVQLDWTYPVDAAQPSGLRWYAQVFAGFGETLLDYNHRQTSVGVGLTLFDF